MRWGKKRPEADLRGTKEGGEESETLTRFKKRWLARQGTQRVCCHCYRGLENCKEKQDMGEIRSWGGSEFEEGPSKNGI